MENLLSISKTVVDTVSILLDKEENGQRRMSEWDDELIFQEMTRRLIPQAPSLTTQVVDLRGCGGGKSKTCLWPISTFGNWKFKVYVYVTTIRLAVRRHKYRI